MTETKKTVVEKKNTSKKNNVEKTDIKNTVKKTTTKKVATNVETTKPIFKKVGKKTVKTAHKKDSSTVYATGKRKNAIAKVWLSAGIGKITVNGKKASEYLKRAILGVVINQPFDKTNTKNKFDIDCTVLGGGLSGQAGAIKHGISKALQLLNPELRAVLKAAGFLTRDSRVVERKKAGLKKARKGQVYQKR